MSQTPSLPADRPWLLALTRQGGGIGGMLSDGDSHLTPLLQPWPPAGAAPALPAAVAATLAQAGCTTLRLQLDPALDSWPWEAELDPAGSLPIVRRLLPPPAAVAPDGTTGAAHLQPPPPSGAQPLGSPSTRDPRWLHGPAPACAAAAVQVQGPQASPLLALLPAAGAEQARRFRAALRGLWGPGQTLAHAALQAAAEAGLARAAWRQYGDATFSTAGESEAAQWRQVSSLSIDLVRSTALLQVWGAELYAQRHAALQARCDALVRAHGGRMDNPQGDDGWMAYFGLLQAREDGALQAVRCGWALLQEAGALGFTLRAGVATGRLAVASGQPFGLEVHLAARLQREAGNGGLLLCERTQALLGATAEVEHLPQALSLAGVAGPVAAWQLRGLQAAGEAQPQRAGQGPFVGRGPELARLQQLWRAVAERGAGRYHCIVGEPGMGKSRLLREFQRRIAPALQSDGGRLLRITGQLTAQASAYQALRAGLQDAGLGAIAALLQGATDADPAARGSPPAQDRPRLRAALVQALLDRARQAPLCCLADDAQWLDPSTVDVLELLRQRLAEAPVLLVTSLRDDPVSRDRGLHGSDAQPLPPLDATESLALVEVLAQAVPEVLRAQIAARAGGVPLFLEETVRMVERLEGDGAAALQRIPATLEDLLMARLDALGPARPLVQLAAVLGERFTLPLWRRLLQEQDDWLERVRDPEAWQRALDSGLLQLEQHGDGGDDQAAAGAPVPQCRFKHALIRDAAYESVWRRDRQRLHGLVAQVLAAHEPDTVGTLAERAQHLAAADQPEAALALLLQAVRRAAAAAADREALALAQRALALLAHLPETPQTRQQALQLHLLQAARHIALDGYGAASVEAAYLRATALCAPQDDPTLRTRIELGLEACYVMRGDLARARALAESAVRSTDWDANLRLALQARWAWMNVAFHQGELLPALDMAEQCLARHHPGLHQPAAVQDPAVMCLCYGAWGLFEAGRAAAAWQYIDRALALAETLQHAFSQAVAHGFAASVAQFAGQPALGLRHADEALRRCTASTFQAWGAHARITRGRLLADLGQPEAGLAEMDAGLALWAATGARITLATYMAMQAEVLLQLQRPAEALGQLEQAADIARRHGERYHEAELLRLQGRALRERARQAGEPAGSAAAAAGEAGEAGEALTRHALQRACEQGKLGFALRAALDLARLLAERGQADAAAALLQPALQAVPEHQDTADAAAARTALEAWRATS